MSKTKQKTLTLKIIRYDSYLNWVIGLALLAVPTQIQSLIFPTFTLPAWLYFSLSLGFLAFAAWQTFSILIPIRLTSCQLQFSSFLAWLPVLALTLTLALIPFTFHPTALYLLWFANLYMLLLGAWYLYLSTKISS